MPWKAFFEGASSRSFPARLSPKRPPLPPSESPELSGWRHCIDAVMNRALRACRDAGVLLERLCHGAGSAMLPDRLAELPG